MQGKKKDLFVGGNWGRDEKGKERFANGSDTKLKGSVLPADSQPHLCT